MDSYRWETAEPTVAFPGEWRKFLPTDLTSPHWYDEEALARLIFAHIADAKKGGRDLPLREFVRQFRGLSGTAKAKQVCDDAARVFEREVQRLSDFEDRPGDAKHLLAIMKHHANAPSPAVLGVIGEEHFRQRFDQYYGGIGRFWYKKAEGVIDGVPFVFEAALAEIDRDQQGDIFHGVNFSPSFGDPFHGARLAHKDLSGYNLRSFLSNAHADPYPGAWGSEDRAHVAVAVHLVCPSLQFMDRGKVRLQLPEAMSNEIGKALWSVTKDIYHEAERRRRDAAREERRERERERRAQREKGNEWTLKEAVFHVLPEAIEKATGGGSYPVSARSLYYQVRPLIQAYTTRELDYTYFAQGLLVEYQREHRKIEHLYYDPRGVLYEPHEGREVPLGTREVEAYTFPSWLFDKILYVEKKGLWPILQAARLADRYDMAIVAAEGYASEAARVLFEKADKERRYQIFVLHDADPYGYNIARTLREETKRMPGYQVDVIDLGLRLEEALDMNLGVEEFTRKKALPEGLELTEIEREHFEGRPAGRKSWLCKRVELNAFSGPDLVRFIERKLQEAGATGKVIPDDKTLADTARSECVRAINESVNEAITSLLWTPGITRAIRDWLEQEIDFENAPRWVEDAFSEDDTLSWRDAVRSRIEEVVARRQSDIEASVKELLLHRLDGMNE